ncbi:hypothetical protein [Aliarcobacter skirrowii]|nr:hypothetical protein [Aliarcobacter skirrowii]
MSTEVISRNEELEVLRLKNENLKLENENLKLSQSEESTSFFVAFPLVWLLIPFFAFYIIGSSMISESKREKTHEEIKLEEYRSGKITSLEYLLSTSPKRNKE